MTKKPARTALDLLADLDVAERAIAKRMADLDGAFAAFGDGMNTMQDRPRWIMVGHLLDALDKTLADPLVQADPVTLAEAQALHDALAMTPAGRAQVPGTIAKALAKPGHQQAGREAGSKRANHDKRQKLAAMVRALPADPGQRPPFAAFLAACVQTTGYTSDGVRKALRRAHGINPW